MHMYTDNTFKSSSEIPCKPSARLQESMRQTEELMAHERPVFENVDELITNMSTRHTLLPYRPGHVRDVEKSQK